MKGFFCCFSVEIHGSTRYKYLDACQSDFRETYDGFFHFVCLIAFQAPRGCIRRTEGYTHQQPLNSMRKAEYTSSW